MARVVDYTVKQIILPFLVKNQFHTPHLVKTQMCNLLKSKLLEIWVCDSDRNLYDMNKIGKDAEERTGNARFMLHAVRITKRKEAEF